MNNKDIVLHNIENVILHKVIKGKKRIDKRGLLCNNCKKFIEGSQYLLEDYSIIRSVIYNTLPAQYCDDCKKK